MLIQFTIEDMLIYNSPIRIFLMFIVNSIIFTYLASYGNNFRAITQKDWKTVKYGDSKIDLDNDVKTNPQLTMPAVGNGPFSGLLLVT